MISILYQLLFKIWNKLDLLEVLGPYNSCTWYVTSFEITWKVIIILKSSILVLPNDDMSSEPITLSSLRSLASIIYKSLKFYKVSFWTFAHH